VVVRKSLSFSTSVAPKPTDRKQKTEHGTRQAVL
jgi:hypothetical protein